MWWTWTVLAVLGFLCVSQLHTEAVKLVLDKYDHTKSKSPCKKGLLHGLDNLLLTGHINISKAKDKELKTFFLEAATKDSRNFTRFCLFDVAKEDCKKTYDYGCYCTKNAHPVYYFTVNKSADLNLSRGQLRVGWISEGKDDHHEGPKYLSQARQLPSIYPHNPLQKLMVDGMLLDLGDSCIHKSEEGSIRLYRFCVHGLESPKLTMIFDFRSIMRESGKSCIEANVTTLYSHFDSSYRFTYSDECGRSGLSSCVVMNRRCHFPKELRGRWKSSWKGKVTFTDTEIRNFYPCKDKRKCSSFIKPDWYCIEKAGHGYFLRTDFWTERKDHLRGFTCLYLFNSSERKFTYMISAGYFAVPENHTYILVSRNSPPPTPGQLCVLDFKMGDAIYEKGTFTYSRPEPETQKIGVGTTATQYTGMVSLPNVISLLIGLCTLLQE